MTMLTLTFNIQFVAAKPRPTLNQNPDAPLVLVVINASIYDDLKFYIERYLSDVERIGFNATILPFSGGSPENVKAILVNASSEGLVGCLLVGDIPSAIYEDLEYDYEEYPIDLFYMDLDGVWEDTDNNGKYDRHTGDRAPEIWVGRIKVPPGPDIKESEVSLIQKYFDKNHRYRTGNLSLPDRALIYIDDDWAESSSIAVDYAVGLVYDNRTIVNENTITRAEDYLDRLTQNWSLVHLMAHGNIGFHEFKVNGEGGGFVISDDIRLTDPHAFFYNLVSCHTANYDGIDYIGGSYIFSDTYGLAVVGPTDADGMLFCSDFYSNFKEKTLGFSFLQWLTTCVADEDASPSCWYDWTWYYGMTILGDPTLSVKPDIEEPEVENPDIAITKIDPYRTVLSNSTTTSIDVTTENQGNTIETFNVTLYYNTSQIGTRTVTLSASQLTVLTFEWSTIGVRLGKYSLDAYATLLPNETDIVDNELIGGWVVIVILGDINADGIVNILDIATVARAYDSYPGHPNWNPNADLDENDRIDILDIATVAKEYGKKY